MPRNHKYAQHFLATPRIAAELIGHSDIKKTDTVLDLGAGSGVISSVLGNRVETVIAIENEPKTLELLRDNLSAEPNVEILDEDIMNYSPPATTYKIFANIPFSLSADVVRRYTSLDNLPESIYLIVQKQFARKLVPSDQHFTSQLGAQISPWWSARIRKPLHRTDFTPPPGVDTVLIELKRLEKPLLEKKQMPAFQKYTVDCFHSQPFFAKQPRTKVGISIEKKPSELTPQQWAKLWSIAR